MIRTQVYIPDDLYRQAMLFVKTQGVKFSHLVREGLTDVVEKKQKQTRKGKARWEDFVGAGKGGPKDLSRRIDYYLYGKGRKKYRE